MSKIMTIRDDYFDVDFSKPDSKPVPRWVTEEINDQYALDAEAAHQSGRGFMVRGLVNASMPYKNPNARIFERRCGDTTLTIVAGSSKGIPYGVYPRLLIAWLATQAVQKRRREIYIGESLREFLQSVIGVGDTGGRSGSRTRFTEQAQKLFGATVTIERTSSGANGRNVRIRNMTVGDSADLYDDDNNRLWLPQKADDVQKYQSVLVLSEKFFNECVESPVPIDLTAYHRLKHKPMAMDIYCWLTYRMSYLKAPSKPIPWTSLMNQYGRIYTGEKAVANFKREFLAAIGLVLSIYTDARVAQTDRGMVLLPSPTHVPPKSPQGKLF